MSDLQIDFDWDSKKALWNRSNHGVGLQSAMTVFRDPLAITVLDLEHGDNEERWITLGESVSRALLVVVHTRVQTSPDRARVRIISARRASRREARQYREGRIDEAGI
jgi:uncharacterized protein